MAEIKPLRAWRYNEYLAQDIGKLTSPLFDVVSEKHRSALYRNPYNSIHLSVPAEQNADVLLSEWKRRGTIKQDRKPAIYVYYQYFSLTGSTKQFCRKGFICNIRVYEWSDRVILRHENTIPKSVNDRIELLEKTKLNVSPTHGLYSDENFELERYMDRVMTNPLYSTEDYQGVRNAMAIITDEYIIEKFINTLKDKTIILADGHHRYEGSLVYKQHQEKLNSVHTGTEGYNFHMMYLTNTESDDLKILPTHRLLKNINNFNEEEFVKRLEDDFIVKPVEEADTLTDIIAGKQWAFGILLKNDAFKITLKPEAFENFQWPFPKIIKELDLTILHYFIIEKLLGIPGKEQRLSENIYFDRSFPDCLIKVNTGAAQVAIITNEVSIEDVKRICKTGYTMPQKSTYFYPKVICGFLFGSIDDQEF